MLGIPLKYSRKWGTILVVYFLALFNLFIISQIMLKSSFSTESLINIALLTFLSALIACAGGFFGGKKFFAIYTVGLILGLMYMFYIAIFDVSPGWADLTSVISYMFFAVAGLVLGIVTEVVLWFKERGKSDSEATK